MNIFFPFVGLCLIKIVVLNTLGSVETFSSREVNVFFFSVNSTGGRSHCVLKGFKGNT